MINDLATIGAKAKFAAADCVGTTSSSDCANDILPIIAAAAEFTSKSAATTWECGDIDNQCAGSVADTINTLANGCANLVAASNDCDPSNGTPLTCSVDMFGAADNFGNMAIKIHYALMNCNPGKDAAFVSALAGGGVFNNGDLSSNRRLSDTPNSTGKKEEITQDHYQSTVESFAVTSEMFRNQALKKVTESANSVVSKNLLSTASSKKNDAAVPSKGLLV